MGKIGPIFLSRYYGNRGMGGGGGLHATELRRRHTERFTKSNETVDEEDAGPVDYGPVIVSGQPTCIGITGRRMSEDKENTWSYQLEEKLEDGRRRRRRGRRRGRSAEGIKLEISESDNKEHWVDDNLEIIRQKTRRIDKVCCKGFRQTTEMAVGTLLLGVVLLVTPGTSNCF